MVTVKVNEFEGYDLEEFKGFFHSHGDEMFQIVVPKVTKLFYSSNEEISWDFAIAAYIGQMLSNLSSKFTYHTASLMDPDDFVFEVKTDCIKELADLLLSISSIFGNSETSEPIDFTSEVSSFMERNKGRSVACQDIFDTALEYHKDEEGNE